MNTLFIILYTIFKYTIYYFLIMWSINFLRKRIWTSKSIMIILGSGGHTGEILIMLSKLDFGKFSNCFIVSAHNDKNSNNKAKEVIQLNKYPNTTFTFETIYRSRNVGQSFKSSIPTTLYALLQAFWAICKTRPSIIVSNGPGVAVPLLFSGYIMKKLMIIAELKILFIESYCRTESVSLTGKIVEMICDKFIVLWESLKTSKREYIGKIL